MATAPLNPTPALLCKLGSIVVHIEEAYSTEGHAFDMSAVSALLHDPEVTEWLDAMDKMAMLPKKRNG